MGMSEKTTVQISVETWRALTGLKDKPGDSIDDVIARLILERESARKPQQAAS